MGVNQKTNLPEEVNLHLEFEDNNNINDYGNNNDS